VGNLKIFVSIRFYVKSILENLKVQKLPFLPFLGSEFCKFGYFQPSKGAKMHKKQNSEPVNVLKLLILYFENPQNWFHVKSEYYRNHEISTLCVANPEYFLCFGNGLDLKYCNMMLHADFFKIVFEVEQWSLLFVKRVFCHLLKACFNSKLKNQLKTNGVDLF